MYVRTDSSGRITEDERSLGQIVTDLTSHTKQLARGEMLLLKRETMSNVKGMAKPIGMAVGAGVVALVTLILLGHTIAWGLTNFVEAWVAFLIVTVLFGLVAAGLGFAAKKGFDKASVAPSESIEQVKEDAQWIAAHK